MRDYAGTTLRLQRIPQARFPAERWRWSVKIPAWMVDGGLKASGANPSGTAMTRRGAIRAAERAVLRQWELDRGEATELEWSTTWDGFLPS